MTEGAWPAGYARRGAGALGPRAWNGRKTLYDVRTLAAFLIGLPSLIGRSPLVDACLRTHVYLRSARSGVVHHQGHRAPAPELPTVYVMACGVTLPVWRVVFTAAVPDCMECDRVRCQQKPERPVSVDRPIGALQGGAAKTTTGVTLPDNSVAGPTDRDPFRSMKNATDNRVPGRVNAESGINRVNSDSSIQTNVPRSGAQSPAARTLRR